MPTPGERRTAYCQHCNRVTHWIYAHWLLTGFWLCLACGAREPGWVRP